MYGQIFAKSDINVEGAGKTMRVWSDADKLVFAVNLEKQLFVIQARCYDQIRSGNFGGLANDVTRELHLELERDEMEKLVKIAMEQKLLQQLGLEDFSNSGKISQLQNENDTMRIELESAQKTIAKLRAIIKKATAALSAEA